MTSKELHKAIAAGNIELVKELLTACTLNQELGLKGTPLCAAIFSNQLGVAELLINSGADVNLADVDGEPLLSLAIRKQHQDIVKLLIKNGADVNKKDSTTKMVPLCSATHLGLHDVMALLLEAGADTSALDSSYNTALHIATQNGDLSAMRLLLSHGAFARVTNIGGNTPLHIAVCQGDLGALWILASSNHPYSNNPLTTDEIESYIDACSLDLNLPRGELNRTGGNSCICRIAHCHFFHQNRGLCINQKNPAPCDIDQGTAFSNDTAMHQAVLSGKVNVLKLLIHAGANVNCQNNDKQTPLLMACFLNRTDIAQILLEAGANPNIEGSRKKFKHNYVLSNTGMIPLGLAAEQNNVKLTQMLIDHGANFGKTSKPGFEDTNPLFMALCRSSTDAAFCLLQNFQRLGDSFDINFQRSCEGTFMFAVAKCDEGQITLAEKLIELGCEVNARERTQGSTALHHAAAMECHELIGVLIDHGADWSLVDSYGFNPLHTCAANDQFFCAQMLVSCGADMNVRTVTTEDNGKTPPLSFSPLTLAIDCDNFDLVHYFLEVGADLTLEPFLFDNCSEEEEMLLEKVYDEDEDLAERLISLAHTAPSLGCCCVRQIREHFRKNSLHFKDIQKLPIPKRMIKKILGQTSCIGIHDNILHNKKDIFLEM